MGKEKGQSSGPKKDWDDKTAKEQGNAGEDTADTSGAGKGDDKK